MCAKDLSLTDRRLVLLFGMAIGTILSSGCSDQPRGKDDGQSIDPAPRHLDVSRLSIKKTVFFQHESVGQNVLDGVSAVANQSGLKVLVTKDQAASPGEGGLIVELRPGLNENPEAKVDKFRSTMEQGMAGRVKIAFMKFCYVDVTAKSDVIKIFDHYRTTMKYLVEKYPGTTFVHLTVPLRVNETSWKTRIKELVGSDGIWEYEDNVARGKYNDLLRREYGGREPVFDIALIESTRPDGTRQSFRKNGVEYHSMVPEYSNDGGHLNASGQRVVAIKLLEFLSSI